MALLTIDLETLPTDDATLMEKIASGIKPPGSMKKADTILAWEQNDRPQAIIDAISKTALDGAYGRICCIGWAWDDEEPVAFDAHVEKGSGLYEAGLLAFFFENINERARKEGSRVVVAGHNILNFDLPYLRQRCIVHGITPPNWWPVAPREWDPTVFDTMAAWTGSKREYISLDRICAALRMEGKGDVDGSQVAQMWAAGRYDDVAANCRDDVRKTRDVARRMMPVLRAA